MSDYDITPILTIQQNLLLTQLQDTPVFGREGYRGPCKVIAVDPSFCDSSYSTHDSDSSVSFLQ